jgi:hypothetical protein
VNSGALVNVEVALTLPEGTTSEDGVRLEFRVEEIEARLEGAPTDVGTERRLLDT